MKPFFISLLAFLMLVQTALAEELFYTEFKAWRWPVGGSDDAFELNAATDAIEWIFQCEQADTITHLGMRFNTRIGGTPCAHKFSLEGVTAAGRADGTIKGGGTAVGTFTPPASTAWNGTWQWVALGTPYLCTQGEFLSAKIADDGSDGCTQSGANGFRITHRTSSMPTALVDHYPHVWIVDGAASSLSGSIFAYKSATKVYGPLYTTITNVPIAVGAERANVLVFPAGACATFKLPSIRANGFLNCANETFDTILYDSAGAVVTSKTMPCNYYSTQSQFGWIKVAFDDVPDLTCGEEYTVSIKPNTASGTAVQLSYFTVPAAEDLNGSPLGQLHHARTRSGGGAWTEEPTRRYLIDLYVSDITAPVASGGGGGSEDGKFGGNSDTTGGKF